MSNSMGSRLKQNPERTFYWFFEATCPVTRDRDPGVQFTFPEDVTDEESCQILPRFCFPYDMQRARDGVAVQHFTFALTDLEGCQRFGFCRLANTSQTCLCILSYLPWFEVFYKLLNNLADYLSKGQTSEAKTLLCELYKQPIPQVSGSVTLSMVPYFIAPDPRSLPSIPENRNLTELIVAVDVGNLLQLYASMLFERRILIFASKLSTLTSCVHALSAVLYPMCWQHIFIPVLPPHLLDYCCAPMPYLIGVHTSLSEKVRSRGLEEVIILNVDTNTLETPFDDLKRIPPDVMSELKLGLKRQAVSPGCGVSRAFLKAQALLFGGYRQALQDQDGELCFNKELLLDHKSTSMKHFLQSAVHLQFFKQFIDSRLDILNKGKEPDDLFEEEIVKCEASAGKSKSYQQLVGNIKKGGGALILNMRSKANMRAKGLTKSGLKNLLSHKSQSEELSLQRGGSMSHRRAQSEGLQSRLPITQHFGKSRPIRPIHKSRALGDEQHKDAGETWDRAESAVEREYDHQKVDDDDGEDSLLCDPEEMDLLGEIFDTLSSRSSHERGLLYGTRSLDLFGPDSHDFITKHSLVNPSQESLFLSISGSDSLHSWHLETTEDLSDLAEDCDQLDLDHSKVEKWPEETPVCDMERQEKEDSNAMQMEVKAAISETHDEKIDEINNYKEVILKKDNTVDKEMTVILGKDLENIEEKKEDENVQITEREIIDCEEKYSETNEEQTDEREQKLDTVINEVTVQYDPDPNIPSSPQSITVDSKPQTSPDAVKQEERVIARTTPPPKVLSAMARFQCQTPIQGLQIKSRIKTFAEAGGPCSAFCSRETQSEAAEEENDVPAIKVSELKKRFEA